MSTKEAEVLEQQRQRRKRINKMKSAIIMTISIWMLVSFLAIIILTVQVIKLNSKFNKLELNNVSKNVGGISTEQQSEIPNDESKTKEISNVVTGIDTDDNMADKNDNHNVYLTFDCELSENTEAILDVLKANNVKATFFISGDDTEECKNICKRIVDEGHTIGMHSYSNRYSTVYASEEAFENDLNQISKYIYDSTGNASKFYRFPGGSSNQISNVDMTEFVKILNKNNIIYFDWNVSAGDASGDYTVEDIVSNVTDGISKYKNSVVLLHDAPDKSTTAEAIEPLVKALQKQKANIMPIDENTYVVQYIKADSFEKLKRRN